MGREIRIALMLAAAACLVAVLVDWAVEELNGEATQPDIEAQQASAVVPDAGEGEMGEASATLADAGDGEPGEASVEAVQEDAGTAQDAAAESHDQG